MFRSILLAAAITAASILPTQAQTVQQCQGLASIAENVSLLREQGISLETIAIVITNQSDLTGDDLAFMLEFISNAYNLDASPVETRRVIFDICISSMG